MVEHEHPPPELWPVPNAPFDVDPEDPLEPDEPAPLDAVVPPELPEPVDPVEPLDPFVPLDEPEPPCTTVAPSPAPASATRWVPPSPPAAIEMKAQWW